jgi:hypothetical protein
VDPVASSREHPIATFFWCGVEKLGIPSQWGTDGAPIWEVDSESVFRNSDPYDAFAGVSHGNLATVGSV